MTKDEMIRGLSAGRTLYQDGGASEAERAAVDELEAEGLITRELQEVEEQYSRWKIRWRHADGAALPG